MHRSCPLLFDVFRRPEEFYDPKDDMAGCTAAMGALSLYLDFINMFMMLLRLFGDPR